VILQKTYQSPSKEHHAMTANHSNDPAQFLSAHLERAEPDLLRSMPKTFIDALMGAEADALCGAP
jgi:putative transposase